MEAKFVSLDVETANADWSSICQIGAARVENGKITHTLVTLVDPEAHFDGMNVSIHGITPEMVVGAPKFCEIYDAIHEFVGESYVASHTPFDRVAVNRVHKKYGLDEPVWLWADTARIARGTWRENFAKSGYGLANVAKFCKIDFRHHDALEDACAVALILIEALKVGDRGLKDWVKLGFIAQNGDPEGPLRGERIVFTGWLSLPRENAAVLAAQLGCDVDLSVTKRTTMLVVGLQEESKLNGYAKSAKHRKAEALIAKGQQITILSEDDFMGLVRLNEIPIPC